MFSLCFFHVNIAGSNWVWTTGTVATHIATAHGGLRYGNSAMACLFPVVLHPRRLGPGCACLIAQRQVCIRKVGRLIKMLARVEEFRVVRPVELQTETRRFKGFRC